MAHAYSRRSFLASAAAAGASLGVPSLAFAQTFPDKSKPIRAIVPSGAGSTSDAVARIYAQSMTELLGANIIVDNRAGAEGVIGMQAAKTAPADGYTILFTSVSTMVINPHLFKKLAYDPLNDFIPLAGTAKLPLFLVVGKAMPFKSAKELIGAAKANPEKYTIGSSSATTRVAGEIFAKAAGIQLLNVPYKNFGDLMTNLASGEVDMFLADATSVVPYARQGLRALVATSSTRASILPDVPTLQEQGLTGFNLFGWHAAYAPANTPAAVVATLRDAVRQSARGKYVKDYFGRFGMEPLDLAGNEFAAFQRAEFDKWGKAVRDAGMAGTM